MKSSDLHLYFNKLISTEDFFESIQAECLNYIKLLSKKGASIPLYFYEDQPILINNRSTCMLIKDITNNNYNILMLGYICDCLTLGENLEFSNVLVQETIWNMADPGINGLSKERIFSYLELLENEQSE